MADAQLSVELTAKIDALRDNFNRAISEAGKWDKATREKLQAVDKGFADLANKVEGSSNKLSRSLAKAAEATSKAGGTIAKGSDRAAFALTNVGRVAQDLPFGFIGIQNNLNPLLESFQALQKETGSAGGALKALGQSLIGPAGLGIALSVVSAGILLYQQYQQKAKKADEEKEKAQRKLIDANEAYFKSLSATERAAVKGDQDAQKEIINLQHLYFAARNVTLSAEERHKAAKALQEQYPNTFKNFSQEEIALGKASNAYKELAQDIFSVARAAAATDIIVENTRKLTLEQLKYNKTQKELDRINQQIASRPAQDTRAFGNAGTGASSAIDLGQRELADLTSKQYQLQQQLNASQKIKTGLVKENLDVEKLITKEVQTQGVVALTGLDRTEERVKNAKTITDVFEDLDKALSKIQSDQTLDGLAKKTENISKAYENAKNALIDIGYSESSSQVKELASNQLLYSRSIEDATNKLRKQSEIQIDPKIRNVSTGVNSGFSSVYDVFLNKDLETRITKVNEAIKQNENNLIAGKITAEKFEETYNNLFKENDALSRLKKFSDGLKSIVEGNVKNTISTLGESIGQSLQQGSSVIESVGTSILGSFGNFLSQFGDLLIEYGAAAVLKGKLDLAALIPGAGIAAGAAAIAAGFALKVAAGAFSSLAASRGNEKGGATAFADGGIISGPTLAYMGEYAGAKADPEVVAPLSKLKNMLGQTDSSGNVTPNSNQTPVFVQQELSIDGKKLVALIRTVQDNNKRIG